MKCCGTCFMRLVLIATPALAIAVLITTLLQGEITATHEPTLPGSLNSLLSQDGVNVTALHHYLDNGPADYQLVVHNPLTYLPVDPRTITDDNAMYLATSYYLASHLSLTAVAQVYDAVEAYTGWSIRYAMTDSRTFPFSGSDTGIFYAPADLTGRVINSEGVPSSFYNVTILGTDGNTYPLGPLPAGVGAAQYNIGYYPAFFDTMLYRIYIGYNGTDVGQSGGIPGLSGAAQGDPLEPGWMLQHFEIEYMTAYVCPGVKNASAGAGCMVATNRPAAVTIANQTNGTDDLSAISYFEGGESILAYYPGVTLEGRVALPGGGPVAGVRVTVYDGWGIPHMTSLTNGNGTFSLVLPPGNDTLELSYGAVNALTMAGSTQISRIKFPVSGALGYDTSPATLYQTFTVLNSTVSGVTFWNVSRSSSYNPSVDPVVRGAQVVLTDPTGEASFTATTDASGTFVLSQVPPGLYNVTVRVGGQTYNESAANVSSGGTVNLTLGLTPGTLQGTVLASGAPYVGATVTLRNATGGFVTVTTGTAGAYNFSGLAPGTYRVSAVGTTPTLVSAAVRVAITGPGANASANLTLAYAGTARVVVSAQGVSLPNATVTFTSQVSFSSSSTSPVEAVRTASANSTFAVTGASGAATVSLPVGYYSVYATSRIGSTLYVGLSGLNISGPGATATTSLVLTPARSLTVTVSGTSPGLVYTPVLAYGVGGVEVTDWAGGNNSAIFELPSGPYTVLALNGALTSGTNASAGLASVNVSGPTFVPVPLSPSVRAFFTVGTPGAQDQILSAANATVTVSVGLTGPRLEETASSSGAVAFLLPSSAPGASGGYCLNASAFGFASASTCGLSANELAGLTSFALAVDPVPVTLTVVGLPSGTSVRVNLTGETIGTSNLSLVGGPTFGFSLTPGVYGVGARAEIGHGTTVYLPSSVLSTEIPIGATSSNLTLVVVPEINASGKLTLPSGYPLGSVTIALASPILNVTVNGTAYTKSFRATPGTYTATVTASQSGVTYVNVSRVTLAADGTISPRLVLSQLGTVANVTLAAPNGASLAISPTVSLVTPTGLTILEHATSGFFSATLPPGTYQVYANGTTEVSGPNGTYLENWTTGPSASCTFPLVPVACRVTLAGTIVTVSVRGVLVPAGGGASVPGTVRLVGPFPSTNLTVLSAPNGSFSARLLPGAYDVYAVSNSGPPLAAFGDLLALPAEPLNISIGLESTWIDSVHLTLPNASGIVVAPATVRVQDVFGDATTFPGQGVGSVLPLALPVGSYTVSANASGTLNGVASSTTISRTVSLLAGNLLTELPISFPLVANVTAALTGPSSATVSAGGQATFDFVVRNTGNIPVTVHPVGSPSTWTFAFSFANRTVAPGANFSAGVRITVPVGTIVDHPPVSIVFDLPNGTQAGELSPAATVKVLGYYGLAAGTIPSVPPQVGSDRALLPFYVTNTGNTLETVLLTVVDAGRLASDGWTTSWSTTAPMTSGQVSLAAGQNLSVSVNLTASSAFLLPPGTVEVETSVVQTNGSITSSFVLHVPRPAVMTSSGTLVVTGPSVQSGPSSLPAWFIPLVAFVPALLLIVGVVTYRWWRTRRWTRR